MAASKSQEPKRKTLRTGVVDSISGHKTVRVVMNNLTRHRLYGKYIRRRTRLLVHDARGEARLGDTVELALSRPISKRKTWRLVRVVSRQAGENPKQDAEKNSATAGQK